MRLLSKSLVYVVVLLVALTTVPTPGFAADAPLRALSDLELSLYGETSPTLSIVERLEHLEVDLLGQPAAGPLVNRIATLTELINGVEGRASINLKISTLEWYSTRKVSSASLDERIANLETLYFGGPQTGGLVERMNRIISLTFPRGEFDVALVKVPDGETVKIKILAELSSETSKIGDEVRYELVEDVRVSNRLIIPAGTEGLGRVKSVTKAGQFGKDGRVEVDFGRVRAIDGTLVPLVMDKAALEKNKSLQLAAGASLAGIILLGPVGLAGGLFIKGQDVSISIGTEFYLQIQGPIPVGGLGMVR